MGDTARANYRRKRGRKAKGPPFVQLHYFLLDSAAWHGLSLAARAAYIELARVYNGINNGSIAMSVRRLAAAVPCNKDTAVRVLDELESSGFIEVAKIGTFKRKEKRATEYRLDAYRCDVTGKLPAKRFDPSKKYVALLSENFGQTVRKNRTESREHEQAVRNFRTVATKIDESTVRPNRTHIESNHGGFALEPAPSSPSPNPIIDNLAKSSSDGDSDSSVYVGRDPEWDALCAELERSSAKLPWSTPTVIEVKRGRGRPKGSKNRPKPAAKWMPKRKRGRPKGSRNKPKVTAVA
jgi:hypothetical protein